MTDDLTTNTSRFPMPSHSPALERKMTKKKEEWMDLMRLKLYRERNFGTGHAVAAIQNPGCVTYIWDHEDTKIDQGAYEFNLRIALRQLGHKIRFVFNYLSRGYNESGYRKEMMIAYATTITEAELVVALKWEWEYKQENVKSKICSNSCDCPECWREDYIHGSDVESDDDDNDDDEQPVREDQEDPC